MFEEYIRLGITEMRPVTEEEIETMFVNSSISISLADRNNGSPRLGDMIARNSTNHDHQWLVAEKYFIENFQLKV